MRIKLPKKIRLLGLKIALTAAVYDGRVRIIDSETVENGKTKELV